MRVIAGRGDAELVPEVDSRHPSVEALYRGLGAGEHDVTGFMGLAETLQEKLEPLLADRDLVVAHNVLTMPFNLPLAVALMESGHPLVAWTHDIAWLNDRYQRFRRDGAPYALLHQPQAGVHYVTVSEVRRRELAGLFGSSVAISTVPNGIDIPGFLGISETTLSLLARAGIGETADPLILVPQRITRRKRLELAVEAAGLLREAHPGLALCVSGPLGPHDADNVAYARELADLRARLSLTGTVFFLHELAGEGGAHPVSTEAIAELYRLADVALMTSDSEGFGLPALETAVARLPLVCPDLDVLVEAGGPGLHLFPRDGGAPGVARAIESALADPRVVDARQVRGRNSWAALLPRIEAVMEIALG